MHIYLYICTASLSVIEGNLAVIRLDSKDDLFPVTSLECENGAADLVVSNEHAAESDGVAPRTAMAWMRMRLSVAEDTIDPLDTIAPLSLGGILLRLMMSYDGF